MTTDPQSDAIAFLADPRRTGQPVTRIDTHISHLFLTPDRVWKIKRALRLPYADFSTLERRTRFCAAEVALNAPHAPGLYLGAHMIRRGPDGLTLDGPGNDVEPVVEMANFGDDALMTDLAAAGRLDGSMLDDLAAAIAAMHQDAARVAQGGAATVAEVLAINEAGFATSHVLPDAPVARLTADFRVALDRLAPLLDARAARGMIRRCHGDLHMGNICLWQGRLCPFDCIEFNDALAVSDVAYDTAFLLMDLWRAGMHAQANRVANRIADRTGDDEAFAVLPFFMALRAAVRAHVTATRAEGARGSSRHAPLAAEAESYLALAGDLLTPRTVPGRVVALAGPSGSGKTTLGEALAPLLAPPPGARLLETDRVRKAMFGVEPTRRLPAAAYAPEVSARVYDALVARAGHLAAAGVPVVATAVLDRAADRQALAASAGVCFAGFRLTAPPDVLAARLGARARGASDADAAVLAAQLAKGEEPGPEWPTLDVSGSPAQALSALCAALGLQTP